MAQPRPNEMPKIIALLAGIGVVLIFAFYQLLGGNRPAETTPNTSGVPAITTTQPIPTTSDAATTGTFGSTAAYDPMIVAAKPGQMRQFIPILDAEPDGTYPPVGGKGRLNSFEKYTPPTEQAIVVNDQPLPTIGNKRFIMDGGRLPGGNFNDDGVTRPPVLAVRPMVDNTPQQEIALDGVVTGNDGFAVLTVREPGRQNAAIPDQRRFARLGDSVGNAKIVEITESGLKLSKTEGTWSVGDKRGVTRRGTIVRIAQPSERTSMPAIDAKLPLISTP